MLRRWRPFKRLARRSKLTLQKANDMQVTQTLSEGLKQEFKVVLPAGDLAAKLETQLAEMRAKAQIKGFRPGKAPISHLKKLYGKSLMSEVLQEAVNEANRKIVDDNKLRIAAEPKLDFPGGHSRGAGRVPAVVGAGDPGVERPAARRLARTLVALHRPRPPGDHHPHQMPGWP